MAEPVMERTGSSVSGWGVLQHNWGWLLALGILWIILGTAAIVMPFAATLAVELLLGGLLVVGGVGQLIQTFRCRGWQGFAINLLSGLLALGIGVILLLYPLQGILTVTLLLAAFFVAEGIFKLIMAYQHRTFPNWGWVMFSGVLSLVIGLLIWLGWPSSAIWAIGMLVGIEFIFSGWSLVMLALTAHRRGSAT